MIELGLYRRQLLGTIQVALGGVETSSAFN